MTLRIKPLNSNFITPSYATDGSGCFDIFAPRAYSASDWVPTTIQQDQHPSIILPIKVGYSLEIPLGFAVQCPEEWTFDINSRSGHGRKYLATLANSTGIIDSDYRNEVIVILTSSVAFDIPLYFACAQGSLTYRPLVYLDIVNSLDPIEVTPTSRKSGFGSTDGI